MFKHGHLKRIIKSQLSNHNLSSELDPSSKLYPRAFSGPGEKKSFPSSVQEAVELLHGGYCSLEVGVTIGSRAHSMLRRGKKSQWIWTQWITWSFLYSSSSSLHLFYKVVDWQSLQSCILVHRDCKSLTQAPYILPPICRRIALVFLLTGHSTAA